MTDPTTVVRLVPKNARETGRRQGLRNSSSDTFSKSASNLAQIATLLETPVAAFFDAAATEDPNSPSTEEVLELVETFRTIASSEERCRILDAARGAAKRQTDPEERPDR